MARALPTPNEALRGPLSVLVQASRGLGDGQGDRARRNARARMRAAARRLLAKMDELYSAPARRIPDKVKRATGRERYDKLKREGWVEVYGGPGIGADGLAVVAAAGVPVTRCVWQVGGGLAPRITAVLIPGWAATIYKYDPKKLTAAVKSVRLRKALLTTAALQSVDGGQGLVDRNTEKWLKFAKRYGVGPMSLHRILREGQAAQNARLAQSAETC